jgi:ribonuclease HII
VIVQKFNQALVPSQPNLCFETILWNDDIEYIAGVDEAGRGALAGEGAAAAVILPKDTSLMQTLSGVRDSKQMTPAQRERWAMEIKKVAITWAVGYASNDEIDARGILPATCLAIYRALEALKIRPQHLLVDYIDLLDCKIPQTPLVKVDARSLSIASASVLAKNRQR